MRDVQDGAGAGHGQVGQAGAEPTGQQAGVVAAGAPGRSVDHRIDARADGEGAAEGQRMLMGHHRSIIVAAGGDGHARGPGSVVRPRRTHSVGIDGWS